MENFISHIGNENSGRYPRGSGKNPYQRDPSKRKRKKITKEDLINTKSPKLAYKYREKYTDDELRKVISRINMEQQLKKMSQKDEANANGFVRSLLKYGKTMNDVIAFINSPAGKMIKKLLF